MKKHNKALDFVTLAMATAHTGNTVVAAKLFAKAMKSPDVVAAIKTLEISNAHAYKLEATAKLEKAAAEKKALIKTQAAQRLAASDDEFDVGDVSDLVDSDGDTEVEDSDDMSDDVPIDDTPAEDEDEPSDEGDDAFEATLAKMLKPKSKAKKK